MCTCTRQYIKLKVLKTLEILLSSNQSTLLIPRNTTTRSVDDGTLTKKGILFQIWHKTA